MWCIAYTANERRGYWLWAIAFFVQSLMCCLLTDFYYSAKYYATGCTKLLLQRVSCKLHGISTTWWRCTASVHKPSLNSNNKLLQSNRNRHSHVVKCHWQNILWYEVFFVIAMKHNVKFSQFTSLCNRFYRVHCKNSSQKQEKKAIKWANMT